MGHWQVHSCFSIHSTFSSILPVNKNWSVWKFICSSCWVLRQEIRNSATLRPVQQSRLCVLVDAWLIHTFRPVAFSVSIAWNTSRAMWITFQMSSHVSPTMKPNFCDIRQYIVIVHSLKIGPAIVEILLPWIRYSSCCPVTLFCCKTLFEEGCSSFLVTLLSCYVYQALIKLFICIAR